MVSNPSSKSKWMTVAEVACELGVSSSSVRRWAKQDLLPAIQPHTMVLINRQTFEDFKVGRDYEFMTSLRGTKFDSTLHGLD